MSDERSPCLRGEPGCACGWPTGRPVLKLSPAEWAVVAGPLESPPAPAEALVEAAASARRLFGGRGVTRREAEIGRIRSLSLVWADAGRVDLLRWAEEMHRRETTTSYGAELGPEVEAAIGRVNGALADLVEACERHDAAKKVPG